MAAIMNVDLHCHTTASDGKLSPAELLALARERNIDLLSITDHDTLSGYQAVQDVASDMKLVCGIELSTTWQRRGVHIVGLNVDPQSDILRCGVAQQSAARQERAQQIAQRLARLGFDNALPGASKFAADGYIGRPHFAAWLVEIGAVKDISQAFKKYLGAGKAGDVREQWADLETVVDWIGRAGGLAVLAHPAKYKLTRTKLLALLDDFIAVGGRGMEVISGLQIPSLTRDLGAICRQKGLLASVGSDFHQLGQNWAELGRAAPLPEYCEPVWHHFG